MGSKPKITLNEFKELAVRGILDYIKGYSHYTPMLIEGASGIGKTSIINQIADELTNKTGKKWEVYTFIAGQRSASDILGIPFPNSDGNSLKWLKESSMPGVSEESKNTNGIFFLDEITIRTDESLRNAILQLTIERQFLGYQLPKGWVVMCAGNRQSDGNSYEKLSFPQRNRLECYEIEFNKNEFIDWQIKNNIHKSVTRYIKQTIDEKEFLTYDPKKEEAGGSNGEEVDETNYVNATPRSWEYVSNAIISFEREEYSINLLTKKIQSLIGSELGARFVESYIRNKDNEANEFIDIESLKHIDDINRIKDIEFDSEFISDVNKYINEQINNDNINKDVLNLIQAVLCSKTKMINKKALILTFSSEVMTKLRYAAIVNDKIDLITVISNMYEEAFKSGDEIPSSTSHLDWDIFIGTASP